MPAKTPRASFEPLPPDFDVTTLVEETENFEYASRISYEIIEQQGLDAFDKLVLLHVVIGGKPLVIEGFHEVLDPWIFSPQWLRANHGDKIEIAYNLTAKENLPLTIGHYLRHMGVLCNQFFEESDNNRDKECQRIYLKDIDCPSIWEEKLREHIPPQVFYLNNTLGEIGGPGANEGLVPTATTQKVGRGIARAGDLMSSLPPAMRAENLMCYIGHEGTYTPAHREMCASLGQNIMVECSDVMSNDGKPEKPGSSIWFMTETSDRHLVSEYWLSVLGHDIEVENHFAQVVAWRKAPFKTYVVEQKVGDFILIPPLAPHQVWNRGTRTMKVAWNRTTVETLELAMDEALPNARMVCRDEQYKNKAIVYYTLSKYSGLLKTLWSQLAGKSQEQARSLLSRAKIKQLQKDFQRLFQLFKDILISEMYAPNTSERAEYIPFEGFVTCAYCRGNIFNRFLTCRTCINGLGPDTSEPYDMCMDCFMMGRSCWCVSKFQWVEQFKWKDLVHKYDEWRNQIIEMDRGVTSKTPFSLQEERHNYAKKTVAQVCQEQLKCRPWMDPDRPLKDSGTSDEDIEVDGDGKVKGSPKKRLKSRLKNHHSCHSCFKRHPSWKMACCTVCNRWWCYGMLFRAFDLLPNQVMQDPRWKCPHCRRFCSTGACRRDPRQNPYEPKGTLLGHDTRQVADARSVESLVDFSKSNLNWLRDDVEKHGRNKRLERRQEQAEREKQTETSMDDYYTSDEDALMDQNLAINGSDMMPETDMDSMIDPALGDRSVDESKITPAFGGYQGSHNYLQPSASTDFQQVQSPEGMDTEDPGFTLAAVDPSTYWYDSEGNDSYLYPDPAMHVDGAAESPFRKRRQTDERIKLDGEISKRQKPVLDAHPRNVASNPNQKEQEKKRLNLAKKDGLSVIERTSMRSRGRKVTMSRSKDKLREVEPQYPQQRQSPRARFNGATSDPNISAKSVLFPEARHIDEQGLGQVAKPQRHRFRVENDDDFKTSMRKRSNATSTHGFSSSYPMKASQYDALSDVSDEYFGPNANAAYSLGQCSSTSLPQSRSGNRLEHRSLNDDAQYRPTGNKPRRGVFVLDSETDEIAHTQKEGIQPLTGSNLDALATSQIFRVDSSNDEAAAQLEDEDHKAQSKAKKCIPSKPDFKLTTEVPSEEENSLADHPWDIQEMAIKDMALGAAHSSPADQSPEIRIRRVPNSFRPGREDSITSRARGRVKIVSAKNSKRTARNHPSLNPPATLRSRLRCADHGSSAANLSKASDQAAGASKAEEPFKSHSTISGEKKFDRLRKNPVAFTPVNATEVTMSSGSDSGGSTSDGADEIPARSLVGGKRGTAEIQGGWARRSRRFEGR